MGATYTRQSTYSDGDVITAAHTNDEFNQLLAAFAATTGHTHDGTTAEGGPITKLLGNTLTFGAGTAGTDITVTFDGETSDGVLMWMEDEDHFKFMDDVVIDGTKRLYFNDEGGEYIHGDGTDLNLVSGADINIPANIGLTFGDDGEKIEGDGTDLTITGNNINLTATADVNIPSGVGITFATAEKIESDGTDLSITVGSGGDINIPADIGLTFGDDGEKIEGDGTDLTITGNNINLTATADVVVPANVGVTFGSGEKIEGDDTDLTITSGAKINLTATSDVHIPNNVGVVFGGDSEKIEGDGTDMTISANNLTVDAVADITLDAGDADVVLKDDGTQYAAFTNSSGNLIIKSGSTTMLTGSGANATFAGNVTVDGNLDVTGTFDLSDSNFTNAGDIQLDSITGDGDTNTSIAFSGSDVITITAGGDAQVTFTNGGIIPSTNNDIDLGSSSKQYKDAFFDGTVTADAMVVAGTIGHDDDTDLLTLADGIVTVAGEISVTTLDIGGTNVTATAAELNLTDGGSSIGTTAVSDGHGILMNHGGTMAQTTVQTLAAYLDDEITAMPNLVTTGALDSGSITSGFGAIDNGSSAITTTGTITGGVVTADDVSIDGKVITMTGSTSDTAVLTAGTNGTLDITTTDDAGANANIQITADGTAELAGTTVTLDSSGGITLDADGGTITFADGGSSLGTITSSGYSGNSATATTATVATTVTITDNESTNEDNAIIFTAGGDVDGGNIGLESDGDLTYNPSTGRLTATQLAGTLQTAAQTNVTSLGTLTALTTSGTPVHDAGISVKNGSTSAGFVEFFEDSDNGTNKVTLIGPSSTSDITLTLPSTAGTIATTTTASNDATALAIALG